MRVIAFTAAALMFSAGLALAEDTIPPGQNADGASQGRAAQEIGRPDTTGSSSRSHAIEEANPNRSDFPARRENTGP